MKLLGVGAVAVSGPRAWAQAREVVIGALYPLSGPVAQAGVDAKAAAETAAEIVNTRQDLDLPLARTEGLPGLGGARLRLIFVDHQGKPELGQSEAERLITQEKAVALYGAYHSSVSSSPTLHRRGFKWFFRTSPHDEHFSIAMFEFLKELQARRGKKIATVGILHEDTLFGADSARVQEQLAQAGGYRIVEKIAYRSRTTSMQTEVQRLKAANPDVLLPTSYTSDAILFIKTARELDYNPPMILAQDAGYVEGDFVAGVGKDADGVMSRSVFSMELAAKRPVIGRVNEMYRKRSGKDLNDNTSRAFTGVMVLAEAINRAGSTDPEAIRKALAATDLKPNQLIMPWKGVTFDPKTGQNELGTPLITQWRGGALRIAWPFDLASGDLLYPLPKWADRR
jgi:branched-chain amino acid transport system substrate-binding protein